MSDHNSGRVSAVRRALAELVLIVSGIMIALAADEWRQGRRDSDMEGIYLAALQADLESEIAWLEANIAARRNATGPILDGLTSSSSPDDETGFLLDLVRLGFFPTFLQVETTFAELESSGRLTLISDAELRRQIISYYSWVRHFSPIEERMQEEARHARSAPYGFVDPTVLAAASRVGWESTFSASATERLRAELSGRPGILDWGRLRSSEQLRVALGQLADSRSYQLLLWESYLTRAQSLLKAIEAEAGAS